MCVAIYNCTKDERDIIVSKFDKLLNKEKGQVFVTDIRKRVYSIPFLVITDGVHNELRVSADSEEKGMFKLVESIDGVDTYMVRFKPLISKGSKGEHILTIGMAELVGFRKGEKAMIANRVDYFYNTVISRCRLAVGVALLTGEREYEYVDAKRNYEGSGKYCGVGLTQYVDYAMRKKTRGVATGNGTKHSYQYTKRAHERHLKNGKVVYVGEVVCKKDLETRGAEKLVVIKNLDKVFS